MQNISLTTNAHKFVSERLRAGDIAVDATAGNGNDTLFLATTVGASGKVYAFDIQPMAIKNTSILLQKNEMKNVSLFTCCHSDMLNSLPGQVPGNVKAIMFNLGYLPGFNKTIITRYDTTLKAFQQSIELLARGGIISVISYPGHPGGDIESIHVEQWCRTLPVDKFRYTVISSCDENNKGPSLHRIYHVG